MPVDLSLFGAGPDSWFLGVVRRFSRSFTLGLIEQIVSSGANFVFLSTLAHLMAVRDFGLYSAAWSGVMLAEGIVSSIFGDTAAAIINKLPIESWPKFKAAYSAMSVMMTCSLVVLCLPAALFFPHLASLIWVSCAGALSLRLQQIFKRLCYLEGHRGLALFGAIVSSLVLLAAVGLLDLTRWRGADAAMAAFAAGSLAPALLLLAKPSYFSLPDRKMLAWTWSNAWGSGRWLLAATFCYWISTLGLIPFAVVLIGSSAGAALRVLQAIVNPLGQFGALAASVILPVAANKLVDANRRKFVRVVLPPIIFITASAIFYSISLTAVGEPLVALLFPGKTANISVTVLFVATMAASFDVVETLITLPQIALNKTLAFLMARISSAVALVVALVLLGRGQGLLGLVLAMLIANLVQACVAGAGLSREFLRLRR
jgi:O-antigen/teichoic acid export membrane protein